MVIASELKAGMAIRIEGGIYKVLEVESKAGAAKLSGLVKTKLSNVDSGRLWEPHFRLQERLENVALDVRGHPVELLPVAHRLSLGALGAAADRGELGGGQR